MSTPLISFPVSEVTQPPQHMTPLDRDDSVRSLLQARVEQLSHDSPWPMVACNTHHPFVFAAHEAFYKHCPLIISPDDIWFCLVQGFAHHIALNAESLRHRFVQHKGKKKLTVSRTDFVLGRDNPWPEVFEAFAEHIGDHVGKLREFIVADFSTTGTTERAASLVALMGTFEPYFEYEFLMGCGIPEITLLGTVSDWQSIALRARLFSEFGLSHWTDVLVPVLERIVESARGNPGRDFWRSFFRYESGSGASELTGWILTLFPYLELSNIALRAKQAGKVTFLNLVEGETFVETVDEVTGLLVKEVTTSSSPELRPAIAIRDVQAPHHILETHPLHEGARLWVAENDLVEPQRLLVFQSYASRRLMPNPYLSSWRKLLQESTSGGWEPCGPSLFELPSGLVSAPVKGVDLATGEDVPLKFVSGHFGVIQDPETCALRPEFGWAVVHDENAGSPS